MKKTLLVMAMVAALALASMASTSDFEPPPDLVTVCHVTPGGSDVIPTFNPTTDLRMFYPGKLIEVAEPAVPAFEAQGGSAMPGNGDGQYRTDEAGLANIRLSAANNGLYVWDKADCFVTMTP
jgi:hypothetical protein